mgnify:CR=1 FL=1
MSFFRTLIVFGLVIFGSCTTKKKAFQYHIEDGIYASNFGGGPFERVLIENNADSLIVFPLVMEGELLKIDTTNRNRIAFPQENTSESIESVVFKSYGFDLDLVTIPFKYRFANTGVPQQLTTNLNASIFVGYRGDIYLLHYKKNEFGSFDRKTRHYGVTAGLFSGLGSTTVNPYTTNPQISIEYDGLVWSNGFALNFGIDYLTLGVGLGWDNLLDGNSRVWIYQRKPWFGLLLGVNLN